MRMASIECFRAGNRQLLILIGAGCAAHADSADDLAIHDDGDAADERREVFEGRHHRAAFAAGVDQFFKEARGLLEHDGGLSLADGDVGAGGERAVEPFQSHQIAAIVHDGDDATWRLQLLGLGSWPRR